MLEIGNALADAIEDALPKWVDACVQQRLLEAFGEVPAQAPERTRQAGEQAVLEVIDELRRLVRADVDAQWTTPLSLVRRAVRFPTEVLASFDVAPVARDRFVVERFPSDIYALTPTSLGDLGDPVGDLSISWGAAKAWEHKERHRAPERAEPRARWRFWMRKVG